MAKKIIVKETEETLVEFPCSFTIKVMGAADDVFTEKMFALIQAHVPTFTSEQMASRKSSSGNYISLSCDVWVVSKPQLDAIYIDLTAHPLVKYAL